MKYFKEVDRLRGIACIMVVLVHLAWLRPIPYLQYITPEWLFKGQSAVSIFFTISGFLVTYALRPILSAADESCDNFVDRLFFAKTWLKAFWIRRIYRLLPVVVVMLSMLFIFYAYIAPAHLYSVVRVLIDTCFFINNIMCATYQDKELIFFDGAAPLWTLCVEGLFYLLYPILMLWCKGYHMRVNVTLAIGLVNTFVIRPAIGIYTSYNLFDYYNYFNGLDSLMYGAFFAFTYERYKTGTSHKWMSLWLTMVLWIYMALVKRHAPIPLHSVAVSHFVAVGGAVLLVLWAVTNSSVLNFKYLRTILEFIGKRSYTYYIMHLPVWCIWQKISSACLPVNELGHYATHVMTCLLYFAIFLMFCEMVYRLVEMKFYEKGRDLSSKILAEGRKNGD